MVFAESLTISILYALFVIYLQLCLCLVFFSQCRTVIDLHGFLLVCVFSCLLCLEGLGNWLGKRKVNGA